MGLRDYETRGLLDCDTRKHEARTTSRRHTARPEHRYTGTPSEADREAVQEGSHGCEPVGSGMPTTSAPQSGRG